MASLVLGVDGGGTKTRALVADERGAILGEGIGGSSNHHSAGLEPARRALADAIDAALAQAGARGRLVAACLGLAGVDRPGDQALLRRWLDDRALAPRYRIVNDAELVLAAGTPDGWGVALICGTGSFCYGRAPDGRIARAGGWGYLLGDEGSGYDLAIQALRVATQTADGRTDGHALLDAILDQWGLTAPEQLIGYVYQPATLAEIATLAPRVLALAEAGDEQAGRLLTRTGVALAQLVTAVVRRLGLEQPPLAFGGGLLRGSRGLREAVASRAPVDLGPLAVVDDPATGALTLARRLAATPA